MLRAVLFSTLLGVTLPALAAPALEAPPTGSHLATPDALPADQPLYAVSTRLDRIGRIVAPVYINGQGPFLFMLDTGANRTVLSDDAVQRLGLTLEDDTIAVQGVNGRSLAPTVLVRRLAAGELRFDNIALPVLAGPVLDQLDGILGMDGLTGKKVTADFVRDRITIVESRGYRAPLNRIVVRGELISGRLMMIEGHVGRVPVKAIIDTGGMRTLGNPALQRALATQRTRGDLALTTSVIDATESTKFGEIALSPTITLGEATIRNTDITYGDFEIFRVWGLGDEPALLIGMDVLGTLAEVAIDYRRRELQLLTRGS
jgi:predicted aspartyl protease